MKQTEEWQKQHLIFFSSFLSSPLLSSPLLSSPLLSSPLLSSPLLSSPLLSSPVLSSPLLSSPHVSINALSPVSISFCCCSPFSSHSFQISLNAVLPSHSQSSSHPFSLHSLCICCLCQFLSVPFQPTPDQFFSLNISLLQPPLSVRPFFSYPLSSLPRIFLSSCFRKPALSPVVSSLVPSFLSHTCMLSHVC